MAEIHAEVERMLNIRAIKLKLSSKFANFNQLPQSSAPSTSLGTSTNQSSAQGPTLVEQPPNLEGQPQQTTSSLGQGSPALNFEMHEYVHWT